MINSSRLYEAVVMNKTMLFAIAATVSANTWAGTDHLIVKYEKEWKGGAVAHCASGAYSLANADEQTWGGPWGSPQAEAYANAWAAALALVKVQAKAEADFAIYRNVPKGLVKNVNFNGAISSSTMTLALAEGTAEAVGLGDSASYAVSVKGNPWYPKAKAVGTGYAESESAATGSAAAGSIAGSLTQALSNVSVNSFGIRQFKTGLFMGNHTYAASTAEAEAFATALAKTFAAAMTYYRVYGDKHVDVSADYDLAAADALANAFAAALAKGSIYVTLKAEYNMGGFGHKKGYKTEQFNLSGDADVKLACATVAKTDAFAIAGVEEGPTKSEEVGEY
ncbi:hypothetical protein ACW73L_18630 [Methylolobus aquaticus]